MLKIFRLIAATVLLACPPLGAQAALLTYDFTVTATSGSLAGDVGSGSLSFDSSLLAVANTNNAQPGLLTDLSFTWGGTTYNASTANTGQISTSTVNHIALVEFGNDCSTGGCTASSAVPNSWWFAYSPGLETGQFAYADSAGSYVSSEVTWTPVPTPLPAAGWLLLSAVLLLGVVFRPTTLIARRQGLTTVS
jgi:hypothetical protein